MDNLIIFCAKYLVFLVPLMVAALYFKQPKTKNELVLAIFMAGIASLILAFILGQLYDNPRPFVSDGTPALINHGNDNGFPSQHTVFAMTLATVVYLLDRRWGYIALGITLLVGWGRVAAHVHHGVDIIAGLAVGVAAGWIGYYLANRLVPSGKQSAVDKKGD